jgi:hypothetical protein
MIQVPRIALDSTDTTIDRYDPLEAPDPQQWLALDESERIDLVEDYHRDAGIRLPNLKAHATLQAVVENQIALGDEVPVGRTLERLMAEGLDRHDALHAIGMELAVHMNDLLRKGEAGPDPNQPYYDALEQLTAESWRRSADEEDDKEPMRILDGLAVLRPLPVEAIQAARVNREIMTPVFLELIANYRQAEHKPGVQNALFFIFHLLGEWREKSAYRPLAKLLRGPPDQIDGIFGGSTTETSHRVMAAVFDGDPQPLYDAILDPEADEFIRSRICEAVAMVTLRDELPRAEAARFLRACYSDLQPRNDCFVWDGWQSAIAMLGLVELKPLVEEAFRLGYISPGWLSLEDFKGDLQRAVEHAAPPSWQSASEFDLFGDAIDELSGWHCFDEESEESEEDSEDEAGVWDVPVPPNVPAVNPYRGVGRNDLCPCGSGKKFKKCCLNKTA